MFSHPLRQQLWEMRKALHLCEKSSPEITAGCFFVDVPETPGPGSSPPTLWFSPLSFETQPAPPAVRRTPRQTARKRTQICQGVHTDENKAAEVGERQGVSGERPRGTSTDARNHGALFAVFITRESCCPLSLFQAWISYMLIDLTFAQNQDMSAQWLHRTSGAHATGLVRRYGEEKKKQPEALLCHNGEL